MMLLFLFHPQNLKNCQKKAKKSVKALTNRHNEVITRCVVFYGTYILF